MEEEWIQKFESEWNSLKERTKKLEYWFAYLNKKMASIEKDLHKFWTLTASLSKLMPEMEQKINELEKKTKNTEKKKKEIPKNLVEEIISLDKIVKDLSTEHKQLKKMVRDVRILQMEAITPDVFIGVVGRIKAVEKKMSELEEELSKISSILSMKKRVEKIEKELKRLSKRKAFVIE